MSFKKEGFRGERSFPQQTYTLTFSERVENHVGMEILGKQVAQGFSEERVAQLAKQFDGELVSLRGSNQERPEAYLCIFRDGLTKLLDVDPDLVFQEQQSLKKDTRALMKGRLVNKRARYKKPIEIISREEYQWIDPRGRKVMIHLVGKQSRPVIMVDDYPLFDFSMETFEPVAPI